MKREFALAGIVSVMASTSVFALTFIGTNVPGEGVEKSKHNMMLYSETAKDSQGRACGYCHTPHHSLSANAADYLPLWAHELLSADVKSTYKGYKSDTVDEITAPLQGATLLCMSCHDGVVAIDQHYGTTFSNGVMLTDDEFNYLGLEMTGGGSGIGKGHSLANDHPVGFSYTQLQKDKRYALQPESNTYRGSNNVSIASRLGPNGLFSCASCHDVHNQINVKNSYSGGDATKVRNYFLLGDNHNSDFCLSCHIK